MFKKQRLLIVTLFAAINKKLDIVIENMATRAQLDDALAQEDQDIKDAAARHEQQLKDIAAGFQEKLDALQAALDGGQDFSAELAALQTHHDELVAIAAAPVVPVPVATLPPGDPTPAEAPPVESPPAEPTQ